MKKLLFLLLIVAGCSDDSADKPQTKYEIDPLFATEVQNFFTEAEARGFTIVKENLILSELAPGYQDANGVHAVSRYYKDGAQRIVEILDIDPCSEMAVFRELAHVFLDKPYVSSGEVIMNPYAGPCAWIHLPTGEVKASIREESLVELFAN